MLFFHDFSCGFRVPSTCRDPQGEMMCLRSAKIAATNDRCPSCPPRHFPLFASPESDCVHLPKSLSLLQTVFLRYTPPPTGSCRGAIGHTIFLSKSAFSIFARQSIVARPCFGATDYKSLILRTGRPQEATFVHWDGMASRHPVPSRIF